MRNSFRIRPPGNAHLNATFKHARRLGDHSPGIVTLDEALHLIEDRTKRKQARAFRDKDVAKAPPTREQLLSIAKAIGASSRSKARVRLAHFSIQDKEIGDA